MRNLANSALFAAALSLAAAGLARADCPMTIACGSHGLATDSILCWTECRLAGGTTAAGSSWNAWNCITNRQISVRTSQAACPSGVVGQACRNACINSGGQPTSSGCAYVHAVGPACVVPTHAFTASTTMKPNAAHRR
jgi:hypothetical protein